tara:strand:+ start:404 stop:538 length:135 start_codon:yes stop_codon:yes gene_type:complete
MKIIKAIYNFFSAMSLAHTASNLARSGDYKGAHKLMMAEFKGWI